MERAKISGREKKEGKRRRKEQGVKREDLGVRVLRDLASQKNI